MKHTILTLLSILVNTQSISADTHVYFSPKGGCEHQVTALLDATKTYADIAMYSLNNSAILEALHRAKSRGVKIRVLLDRIQAGGNTNRVVTLALKSEGFDIRVHSKNKIQHNKFGVFDDMRVITGSFNWTNPAENSNEENCLVIDDTTVVKSFEERFSKHLWVVNTEQRSLKSIEKLKQR